MAENNWIKEYVNLGNDWLPQIIREFHKTIGNKKYVVSSRKKNVYCEIYEISEKEDKLLARIAYHPARGLTGYNMRDILERRDEFLAPIDTTYGQLNLQRVFDLTESSLLESKLEKTVQLAPEISQDEQELNRFRLDHNCPDLINCLATDEEAIWAWRDCTKEE